MTAPRTVEPIARQPREAANDVSRTNLTLVVVALFVVLVLSVVAAVALGPTVVPPGDTLRYLGAALTGGTIRADEISVYSIVWEIRTPRALLAAVVGAGLSVIGVAVQAMVRNSLADPFVLGVSSGASVGAAAVVALGAFASLGVYALSGMAFAGALGASGLVYLAAHSRGGLDPLRLVLVGVALAYGFQAVMSVMIFMSPHGEAARAVLYWLLGSLGAATWRSLPIAAAAVLLAVVVLHRNSRALDVMAFGDETASSLGVDTTRLRRWLFLLTAVVTGAIVAVSGAIGFVGLVMPHLVRLFVGSRHVRVLTIAPFAGAIFLVWVDLVSRTLVAPRELPLGVITALIGVPVFVTLMRRRRYVFGGN